MNISFGCAVVGCDCALSRAPWSIILERDHVGKERKVGDAVLEALDTARAELEERE